MLSNVEPANILSPAEGFLPAIGPLVPSTDVEVSKSSASNPCPTYSASEPSSPSTSASPASTSAKTYLTTVRYKPRPQAPRRTSAPALRISNILSVHANKRLERYSWSAPQRSLEGSGGVAQDAFRLREAAAAKLRNDAAVPLLSSEPSVTIEKAPVAGSKLASEPLEVKDTLEAPTSSPIVSDSVAEPLETAVSVVEASAPPVVTIVSEAPSTSCAEPEVPPTIIVTDPLGARPLSVNLPVSSPVNTDTSLRRKCGALVRPALRRSQSQDAARKSVHFLDKFEHIRLFSNLETPSAVTSSPTRLGPIRKLDLGSIDLPNFPAQPTCFHAKPVSLESIILSANGKELLGQVQVQNLAFEKMVEIRYTLDSWKTCLDVVASYKEVIIAADEFRCGLDRFKFSIPIPVRRPDDPLADVDSDLWRSLELALKYRVAGQDHWDNNGGRNYKVDIRQPPLPPASYFPDVLSESASPFLDDEGETSKLSLPSQLLSNLSSPVGSPDPSALRSQKSITSFAAALASTSSSQNSLPLRTTRKNFGIRYDFGASLAAVKHQKSDARPANNNNIRVPVPSASCSGPYTSTSTSSSASSYFAGPFSPVPYSNNTIPFAACGVSSPSCSSYVSTAIEGPMSSAPWEERFLPAPGWNSPVKQMK